MPSSLRISLRISLPQRPNAAAPKACLVLLRIHQLLQSQDRQTDDHQDKGAIDHCGFQDEI